MSTVCEKRSVILQMNNITDIPDELHDDTQIESGDTLRMSLQTKHDGDKALWWNPKNPQMVLAAEILFNEALKEGMEAYLSTPVAPKKPKKVKEGEAPEPVIAEEPKRKKLTKFPTDLKDGEEIVFLPMDQKVGG